MKKPLLHLTVNLFLSLSVLRPTVLYADAADGKDTAVIYFDLRTLATLSRIHIEGLNPDIILYESTTKNIFVCNGKSRNAVVMDPSGPRPSA